MELGVSKNLKNAKGWPKNAKYRRCGEINKGFYYGQFQQKLANEGEEREVCIIELISEIYDRQEIYIYMTELDLFHRANAVFRILWWYILNFVVIRDVVSDVYKLANVFNRSSLRFFFPRDLYMTYDDFHVSVRFIP